MDDLISRKAVQEALCADTEEGTFTFTEDQAEAADKIIRYVVKTLRSVPSVPAVPLDKLCEWLSGYAEPPLDALTMCENEFEAWKLTLTKVMEEEPWR